MRLLLEVGKIAFPVYLLLAALFLLMNAFFVLAEFAIVRVRLTRLEDLAQKGSRRALIAASILKDLDNYLAVCQLGITIASLGLGWIGEPALARAFQRLFPALEALHPGLPHVLAVSLAFVLITFLHILLGEQIPKIAAIRRPDQTALAVAGPLRFFRRALHLPMRLLSASQNLVLKLLGLGIGPSHESYSEEELRTILSLSEEHGSLPLEHLLLFENLFDFGKMKVKDAMLPIAKAEGISLAEPIETCMEKLRASTHSRLLAFEADPAKPVGFLHVKDLWKHPPADAAGLRALAHPLLAFQEKTPLEAALRGFQQARAHLAVVATDKGKATGILTLEDVLEELVGNVEDEFEKHPVYFLADLLLPNAIRLELAARDARGAIRELCELAASTFSTGIPADPIFKAALEREQIAPTYLGHGVAVPHARIKGLKAPRIALGRSREGIVFDLIRKDRTHLVFLLLTPAEQPHSQVQVLARVVALVQSAYLRKRLMEAESPQEILDLVRSGDPVAHGE